MSTWRGKHAGSGVGSARGCGPLSLMRALLLCRQRRQWLRWQWQIQSETAPPLWALTVCQRCGAAVVPARRPWSPQPRAPQQEAPQAPRLQPPSLSGTSILLGLLGQPGQEHRGGPWLLALPVCGPPRGTVASAPKWSRRRPVGAAASDLSGHPVDWGQVEASRPKSGMPSLCPFPAVQPGTSHLTSLGPSFLTSQTVHSSALP